MKIRARAVSTSSGAGEGWAVITTLLSGALLWGGIGYLLDRWWEVHFLLPIGVVLGFAFGVYAVVMRYGRAPVPTDRAVVPSEQSPWVAPFESRLIAKPEPDPRTHRGDEPKTSREETRVR